MAATSKSVTVLALGEDGWLYYPAIESAENVQTIGKGPCTHWERLCHIGSKKSLFIDGEVIYGVTKDDTVEVQRFAPAMSADGWKPHAGGRVRDILIHDGYLYGTGVPDGRWASEKGGPVFRWTYTGDGPDETKWEQASKGKCIAIAAHGTTLYGLGDNDWVYTQPFDVLSTGSRWNKGFQVGFLSSFVVLDGGLVYGVQGGCVVYGQPSRLYEVAWKNPSMLGLSCAVRAVVAAHSSVDFFEIAKAQTEMALAAQAQQGAAPSVGLEPDQSRLDEIILNNSLAIATSSSGSPGPKASGSSTRPQTLPRGAGVPVGAPYPPPAQQQQQQKEAQMRPAGAGGLDFSAASICAIPKRTSGIPQPKRPPEAPPKNGSVAANVSHAAAPLPAGNPTSTARASLTPPLKLFQGSDAPAGASSSVRAVPEKAPARETVREDDTTRFTVRPGMDVLVGSAFRAPVTDDGRRWRGYLDNLRAGDEVHVLYKGTQANGDEDWLYGRRVGSDDLTPGWLPEAIVKSPLR